MNVIAIGDVALVRHMRNDAMSALKALSEFVGDALHRRAVQREADICLGSPFAALVVEKSHDRQCKCFYVRLCM